MNDRRTQATRLVLVGIVFGLIGLGLLLRVLYTERPFFHPDEYVSMVVAKMVAERGAPILPSGLWYDHEFIFSYLGGLFIRLLGVNYLAVRWVSVFFGVLSIPMAYITAHRLLSSRLAGVTAAALMAVAPEAVLWGGRARRYSMGEFCIWLMVWLIWVGLVEGDRRKYRFAFYAVYALAAITLPQTILIVPPLLLAVLLLAWRGRPARGPLLARYVVVSVTIIALISIVLFLRANSNFTAPEAAEVTAERLQGEDVSSFAKSVAAVSPFLLPTFDIPTALSRIRWLGVIEPLYPLLAVPALLAVVLALVPGFDTAGKYRRATWFLLITASGVAFEFLFLVSEDWTGQRPRYLFVSFWPAFTMLACGLVAGLEMLVRRWRPPARFPKLAEWVLMPATLLPLVAVLAATMPRTLDGLKHSLGDELNYHQAFQYVSEHWRPGDQVMTVLTTISYWYLGQTDYYAVDRNPFVFQNSDSEMVDRRLGARWVSNPEELDEALRSGRVWFVIDKSRLWNLYTLAFKQQILARMEMVFQADQVYVLLPKRKATAIPTQPDAQLQARLAGQVELTGFSLDQAALLRGAPAQLTLFWKPLQSMDDYKVFVHLRDRTGRTVAQADHIPSEALVALPTSTWREGEIVPDVSYLQVPADTPPGEYQLLVGMYNPDTLERLPVEGDTSGENAVVVTTLRRP
jgi:4-amino-4-deoxy-L-arabinose transferase-like glycosyltransferase